MKGVVAPLIKLGIFALVTVLSVLLLLTTIQNQFFGSTETYKADFTDASGLIPGSDVRIAGVRIGEVSDVEVVDRSVAQVSFSVEEDRKLPTGAQFAIKYQNLVGQRYLDIQRGNGPMNQYLQPGQTVPVTQTQPPLNLTTVFNGFKPLFQALNPDDVNRLSFEIIQVLQGEGGNINTLLANTASLTSTIADRDAVIGDVINNLNTVLGTVDEKGAQFNASVDQLQKLVSGLAADRDPIAGAIPPLADDIVKLGQESDILNRNRGLVENALRNIPQKANNFGRAGSYGSWFNFYLCQAGVTIDPTLPGPIQLPIPPISASIPVPGTGYRCGG